MRHLLNCHSHCRNIQSITGFSLDHCQSSILREYGAPLGNLTPYSLLLCGACVRSPQAQQGPRREYPFAVAGINITRLLAQFTRLISGPPIPCGEEGNASSGYLRHFASNILKEPPFTRNAT